MVGAGSPLAFCGLPSARDRILAPHHPGLGALDDNVSHSLELQGGTADTAPADGRFSNHGEREFVKAILIELNACIACRA